MVKNASAERRSHRFTLHSMHRIAAQRSRVASRGWGGKEWFSFVVIVGLLRLRLGGVLGRGTYGGELFWRVRTDPAHTVLIILFTYGGECTRACV